MITAMTLTPCTLAESTSTHMDTKLDFLHRILDSNSPYPWNLQDPEYELLLTEAEAALDDAATERSLADGWRAFSTKLDYVWTELSDANMETLMEALTQRFALRMPEALLKQLAQQALAAAAKGGALLDQLVGCTQSILSNWNSDDLAVLARPLAYSLRDGRGEILDLHLRSVRQADWDALSDIEQARLTLAIASFALKQARIIDA